VDYFLGEGIAFDAALAAADLAFFQLREGLPEAATTALTALQVLEAEKLDYPEGYAALTTLTEAVRRGALETQTYRDLVTRVEFSRFSGPVTRLPSDGIT